MVVPFGLAISVVIPTLNEQPVLAERLSETRGAGIERIVVDGGSSDGTVVLARECGAERVLVCEAGRGRQLEAGLRVARGDVVLFLHADTRLTPAWASAVRGALADPGVAGGAFRLRFDAEGAGFRWVELWAGLRARVLGLPYGDQALFARRSVLEASGGIAQVPIFEDLDLARTVRRAGRLALLSEPAVTSARRYREHGAGRVAVRNSLALAAYLLGLDRERVARWYTGRSG